MATTIYYEGNLLGPRTYPELAERVRAIAARREWLVRPIDAQAMDLARVVDGEIREYTSPVKGLLITVDRHYDPVRLVFDQDWWMQEFTRTDHGPPTAHVRICEFLRELEDLFVNLQVIDEGEYWATGTTALLERRRKLYPNEPE